MVIITLAGIIAGKSYSTDDFELLVDFVITILFVIKLVQSERSEFYGEIRTRFIAKSLEYQTRQDKKQAKKYFDG